MARLEVFAVQVILCGCGFEAHDGAIDGWTADEAMELHGRGCLQATGTATVWRREGAVLLKPVARPRAERDRLEDIDELRR